MRIGQQTPADSIPTVGPPAELIKYPQTFDSCCPPFTGAERPKFWPKFRPQSSSECRVIELGRLIGKQKQTCQGPMIGLPLYQTRDWWVLQLLETLAQLVPQRVKVENFLYIRQVSLQRHQCCTIYWGRSWCKKTTVHISQFASYISQGLEKSQQPPIR